MRERGCTDILCLIVFIATLVAFGFCVSIGYSRGDVNRLTAPIDGDNNFCGSDSPVKKFQKLYITNLGQTDIKAIFQSGVCVKSCPVKDVKLGASDFHKTATFQANEITFEYSSLSVMDFCLPTSKNELPENLKEGFKLLE